MAFGDRLGTGTITAASIPATIAIPVTTGAVSFADLIIVAVCQQTALTVSAASDNLGNTYFAQNAGTDPPSGTPTGRMFYSRVDKPGTLTTVSVTATSSANNYAAAMASFAGPFRSSPEDVDPGNKADNLTSSFTTNLSGTLTQPVELLVGWAARATSASWVAVAPFTGIVSINTDPLASVSIATRVTTATTSIGAGWTASVNTTGDVLGLGGFMQDDVLMGQRVL